MNKNEQNRVVAWPLKLLRKPAICPGASCRPADTSAFLARASTSMDCFRFASDAPLHSCQGEWVPLYGVSRSPPAVAPRWVIRTRTLHNWSAPFMGLHENQVPCASVRPVMPPFETLSQPLFVYRSLS